MSQTNIQQLNEFGQSVWLDYLSRSIIKSGKLKEMIGLGLRGMTSNPTIFEKSIGQSNDYDEYIINSCIAGQSTFEIYDDLTIKDIQDAADMFLPVYEESNGLDGYVSLEINPNLAYKAEETIEEGKRLRKKVNRPNVMFKVPATDQGFKAIEELTASGININITLMFSVKQYINTAHAYKRGIKRFLQNKGDVARVCSVASIFVSRIDTLVDNLIEEMLAKEQSQEKKKQFRLMKGKSAVANSQLVYRKYLDTTSSAEFKQLQDKGVRLQRLLFGSTGTKNPAYSDIKYVTELIGKNTINTVPEHTFYAFLDHGEVKEALTPDDSNARKVIDTLKSLDIDIDGVCEQLLKDGVVIFSKSFESLLHLIEEKAKVLC